MSASNRLLPRPSYTKLNLSSIRAPLRSQAAKSSKAGVDEAGGRREDRRRRVSLVPRPQVARHCLFERLLVKGRGWQQVQSRATTDLGNVADALPEIVVLSGVLGATSRNVGGVGN